MLQQTRLGCRRTIERGVNNFHYAFDVLADIVVPDANDSVTFSFRLWRPLLVAALTFFFAMLRTIDFDDEPSGGTGKIDHIVAGGHLPSEVRPFHLKAFQMPP